MECDKNCSTCQSTCGKTCPVCGATAIGVNTATVLNLTDVDVNIDDRFYLCLNGNCNAAYFSDSGTLIEKTEVKVPIWFKSNFFEYIVCYCRKIYLKDVMKAVFSLENPTKEEIITLWATIFKTSGKSGLSGYTNEKENLIGFYGDEKDTKRPYIRIYFAKDNK